MLLNLKSQKSSPFHIDMTNKYWEDDEHMQNWYDKIHDMEQTSIINIPNMKGAHLSSLNPDIWLESKFEYNDFPAYVELPKPRDKRNRKFNILLGRGYSSFFGMPYQEYKKLSNEEQKAIRKESNTKFHLNSYGVCDSPEQLYPYIKFLDTLDKKYAVFFTEMNKEDQSEEGGWRWEKWGEYVGKQKPMCQYLYDEPLINRVYIFSVMEVIETDISFSTDLFDVYYKNRTAIVYNKQGEFVCDITNNNVAKQCYVGRKHREGYKPWLEYVGLYQNNIKVIVKDLETIYKEYLSTGSLPNVKEETVVE